MPHRFHFLALLVYFLLYSPGGAAQTPAVRTTVSSIDGFQPWADGADGRDVDFRGISGFLLDDSGVMYISSRGQHRVYRVAPDRTVTVFAGIGGVSTLPPLGDGGPATQARLNAPMDIAVDKQGNVYIADSGNNRIRKVDRQGIITTVAGTGVTGFSGDGGPAVAARLARPENILIRADGTILISDVLNHRVRVVDRNGWIGTFAGDGNPVMGGDGGPARSASLHYPRGLSEDSFYRVYIADCDNRRVRLVDTNGTISTVAGGALEGSSGPLATDWYMEPISVHVEGDGTLYIGERSGIRRVNPDRTITGKLGNFSGGGTYFSEAMGIKGRSGYVYFANSTWVGRVLASGFYESFIGTRLMTHDTTLPQAVAVDAQGTVYAGVLLSGRLLRFQESGVADWIRDLNSPPVNLIRPSGILADAAGNIYISDPATLRVHRVGTDQRYVHIAGNGRYEYSGDGDTATQAGLKRPRGMALDASGNLYIADQDNHRIRKVTPGGIITTVAGNGDSGFAGDNGPASAAVLSFPGDMVIDSAQNLYFSDTGNRRIRKISAGGLVSTVAGNGNLPDAQPRSGPALTIPLRPDGIAFDAVGNLYIVEPQLHRIRRLNREGMIETFAGNSIAGYAGDGGPALEASFDLPLGIAVDSQGNVYIADSRNNRIRKITVESGISVTSTAQGGASAVTSGIGTSATIGFGRIRPVGDSQFSGVAIYGYRQNGVLIAEAGVPAVTSIRSGAFYAESGGSVRTGVAIANPNAAAARIDFLVRRGREVLGSRTVTLGPNQQIAAFLDESPFGQLFSGGAVVTFNASSPIATIALRGLWNERGEFLFTTLPVVNTAAAANTAYIPHFVEGSGWTTKITLFNPGYIDAAGTVEFRDPAGTASVVTVNGQTGSAFPYALPPGGFTTFTTAATSPSMRTGHVRLLPAEGEFAPAATLLFSFRNNGITVTEGSVASAAAATQFQTYVESSGDFAAAAVGSIRTGFAVSNSAASPAFVRYELVRLDGSPVRTGLFTVPANGNAAMLVNELPDVGVLPDAFQGALRLFSSEPVAMAGLRLRYNERRELLIAATPAMDQLEQIDPNSLVFPHIVDSGGFSTQFILLNRSYFRSSTGAVELFSQAGAALDVWIR